MRVKLDENLPSSVSTILKRLQHDVHTVSEEKLTGSTDDQVWEAAQREQRFLITQDLDFSDIRRFLPGTHHGILLVRLRDPDRQNLIFRLQEIFLREQVSDWARCFVVATEYKIRVVRPKVALVIRWANKEAQLRGVLALRFPDSQSRRFGSAADAKMLPELKPGAMRKLFVVPSIGGRDVTCGERPDIGRFKHFLQLLNVVNDVLDVHALQSCGRRRCAVKRNIQQFRGKLGARRNVSRSPRIGSMTSLRLVPKIMHAPMSNFPLRDDYKMNDREDRRSSAQGCVHAEGRPDGIKTYSQETFA